MFSRGMFAALLVWAALWALASWLYASHRHEQARTAPARCHVPHQPADVRPEDFQP